MLEASSLDWVASGVEGSGARWCCDRSRLTPARWALKDFLGAKTYRSKGSLLFSGWAPVFGRCLGPNLLSPLLACSGGRQHGSLRWGRTPSSP
eukprot:4150287-Pyramimonas_sp.AAC.1